MSLSAGLFDFLSAGMSVGERVQPLSLPKGAELPFLTYRIISDDLSTTHATLQDSPARSSWDHRFTRVQFDCYAASYDEAEALCDELRAYAIGYVGMWDDVEVDAVIDADVRLDDWDEGPGVYRSITDLIVGHRVMVAGS